MNTLANRIREAREKVGLSQAEVAKSLNISASAVNQWEQGLSKNIKLEHFFDLAALLQQDPQWLGAGTVFPQRRRTRATLPARCQPVVSLNGDEKVLLHHFRRLPDKLRRQLLKFIRGLGDLLVEEKKAGHDGRP